MAGNGWKWLDMVGYGRICLKWLEIAGIDWNGWKWLEMAGNGWIWLKMALNSYKYLEIVEHFGILWKLLEIA